MHTFSAALISFSRFCCDVQKENHFANYRHSSHLKIFVERYFLALEILTFLQRRICKLSPFLTMGMSWLASHFRVNLCRRIAYEKWGLIQENKSQVSPQCVFFTHWRLYHIHAISLLIFFYESVVVGFSYPVFPWWHHMMLMHSNTTMGLCFDNNTPFNLRVVCLWFSFLILSLGSLPSKKYVTCLNTCQHMWIDFAPRVHLWVVTFDSLSKHK